MMLSDSPISHDSGYTKNSKLRHDMMLSESPISHGSGYTKSKLVIIFSNSVISQWINKDKVS